MILIILETVFLVHTLVTAEPKAARTKTMAVCVVGPTHGWTVDVKDCARRALEKISEKTGWSYILMDAASSSEQSRKILELRNKMDCLVLLPMDGASLKTAAVMVQESGTPIVVFDREIPDFFPNATVKGDNYGIGEETAKHFNRSFPKGTTVLELMGDTSTVPLQRMDGYDDTIADNIRTVEVGFSEWQRDISRSVFRRWVNEAAPGEKEAVGAVFTHDDEIALGVLDVLDGYARAHDGEKLLPNLKVIAGSSNSQEFYRRIEKETEYELFSLRYPPEMVEKAIGTAERIMAGEPYEDMTIFPTEEVNRKNVKDFLE